MIIDLFVVLFIVAFMLTILAIGTESIAYIMLGMMFWMVLFVQSLYLTDMSGTVYYEFGISALCMGFIFVHLMLLIFFFLEWREKSKMP
jgi:hypothetical protein